MKISYTLPEQINYDEREEKEKSYRIIYFLHFKSLLNKKKESFSLLVRPISIGDFVTEMEWQPLVSANHARNNDTKYHNIFLLVL